MYYFLEIIAEAPIEALTTIEVVKSLLANSIGEFNADQHSTVDTESENFIGTVRLIEFLGKSQWLPAPLSYIGDILSVLSPKEVVEVLMIVWNFLRYFQPKPEEFEIVDEATPEGTIISTSHSASQELLAAIPEYEKCSFDKFSRKLSDSDAVPAFMNGIKTILRLHVKDLAHSFCKFFK